MTDIAKLQLFLAAAGVGTLAAASFVVYAISTKRAFKSYWPIVLPNGLGFASVQLCLLPSSRGLFILSLLGMLAALSIVIFLFYSRSRSIVHLGSSRRCSRCGYPVDAQDSDVCSECGLAHNHNVERAAPQMRLGGYLVAWLSASIFFGGAAIATLAHSLLSSDTSALLVALLVYGFWLSMMAMLAIVVDLLEKRHS